MPGPAATTSTPSSVTCPSPVTWPAPPTARVTPGTPSAASSAARARRMRGVGTVALTGAMAKLGDARRLGRLTLADFDCDALGAVFADAYALRHGPERARDAASQVVDAADLTRGDAGG